MVNNKITEKARLRHNESGINTGVRLAIRLTRDNPAGSTLSALAGQ
ncbi:hypothetical protein IV102_13575 [bacterium]|nr:hypothetical protein [bacterium]